MINELKFGDVYINFMLEFSMKAKLSDEMNFLPFNHRISSSTC